MRNATSAAPGARLAGPAFVVGLALLIACAGGDARRVDVRIGTLLVHAEVARTTEERSLGLAGRNSLPADAGMVFTTGDERIPSLWMRGMRFPIDIIFISKEGRVTDVVEGAPVPDPGTPDAELARYRPDEPVLYALEVNAGTVERFGITSGDAVDFEPEP